MSEFTLPRSTIFATSTVSGSDTRSPSWNFTSMPEALHVAGDVRAAAVDDDRVHPHVLEEDDVRRESVHQLLVGHRGAAVLDDDGAPVELPDVGQRLEERLDAHVARLGALLGIHVVYSALMWMYSWVRSEK